MHDLENPILRCGKHTLNLSRPHVMGILNVTPDSFSDGARYNNLDTALRRAEQMFTLGASIIDIGGESTRPGAAVVTVQKELDRVAALVELITREFDVIVSVDRKSVV